MTHALPAVLVASLAFPTSGTPQGKPDFSGTWIMDASRSESPVQNEPVKSLTVVISQAPYQIGIETKRDDRVQSITYRPGSPDALTGGRGRSGLLDAIWYWQGDKLVTETLSDVNGMTMRTKAIHTLQSGGAELSIESLVVVEHGYTLRGARNYGSVTDIFKKTAP
jgi:hypothetical protein